MHLSGGSAAARRSTREREDVYPDAWDYKDLPQRRVSLSATWREPFATRLGSNQLVTL